MAVSGTRDALIAAAATLLDGGGREAVTLRAVAEAVGVSHNAPYRHFADKEALLATVAARELDGLAAVLGGAAASDALGELVAGYLGWALNHPHRFRLAFGPWRGEQPELGAAAGRAQQALVAAVGRALGTAGGDAGRAPRVAALLHATLHGAADLTLNGHLGAGVKGGVTAGDIASELLALALGRGSGA